MTGVDDERAALERRIATMTARFESGALTAIVGPLLSLELTIQQLKVLTVLVTSDDGTTLTTLATSFDVSLASMSGIVDRLVAQGVAERATDPDDQRVRRLRATRRGRTAIRHLMARRPEYGMATISRLELEDLRALEQGMRAVEAAMVAPGTDGGAVVGR